MISRIDHVSLAVKDYEKAFAFFTRILGAIPQTHAKDRYLKYYWEILKLGDLSRIELLKPLGEGSFLEGFLKNREGGVHHLNLETPDIKKTKQLLDENNIPYFGYKDYGAGWKELFIHPKDAFGVLLQIGQFNPDDWLAKSSKMEKGKKWDISKKDGEVSLTFKHPGGGNVTFTLDEEEIKRFMGDLASLIND